METQNKISKIVYLDNDQTKVIKGTITEDTEFLITIKACYTNSLISIGKRSIVKIEYVSDGV